MKILSTIFLFLFSIYCIGQNNATFDSLQKAYMTDLKNVSNAFSENYYPNRTIIYSLNENQFLKKIDSLKQPFLATAKNYENLFNSVNQKFILQELRDIDYYFDRMIVDYPYFHETYTGKKVKLSKPVLGRLNLHLKEFNNPELLVSRDFKEYVQAVLRNESNIEVKKNTYKTSDNKRTDAYLQLIQKYFTNPQCKEYWQFHYLSAHLEDWGSKNMANAIESFLSSCKNTFYTKTIDSIYTVSTDSYKGHLIEPYKNVGSNNLDLHIFLPDSSGMNKKRPVIVYFHGGSWTQGTPEWDFYNCETYAKKGWVAVAVEYRIADRHETTPFEAVKDAKSAIRWLRMNADSYHIDTNRIVASGNSSGGHLVLATAMAGEINEATDNPHYSACPNLLLINSGVYELTYNEGTAWISKGLKNKKDIEKISPQQLLRKNLPPMLVIHGTNDQSVNYLTAKKFANDMSALSKDFEFHTLEGAPHFIWYDRRFSGKVKEIRTEYLRKYGYE